MEDTVEWCNIEQVQHLHRSSSLVINKCEGQWTPTGIKPMYHLVQLK